MDTGIVVAGRVESDAVDGHFLTQLQRTEASDALTVFFYIGADKKDFVLEFGGGYALSVVRHFDACQGRTGGGAAGVIDDQVDAGGFGLEGIVQQLTEGGERIPVTCEKLLDNPGMGGQLSRMFHRYAKY